MENSEGAEAEHVENPANGLNKSNELTANAVTETNTVKTKSADSENKSPSFAQMSKDSESQTDSEPLQSYQNLDYEKASEKDKAKTRNSSNFIGDWNIAAIVPVLVLGIILAIVISVFSSQTGLENRLNNITKELDYVKTKLEDVRKELKDKRAEFGNQNKEFDLETPRSDDGIHEHLIERVTDCENKLKELENTTSTDQLNLLTLIKELSTWVSNNHTELSKNLTSYKQSFDEYVENAKKNFDNFQASLVLVKVEMSEKMNVLDERVDTLEDYTKKESKHISKLNEVVDKIVPNTFNKDALITAFFIVIGLIFVVLFLALQTRWSLNENVMTSKPKTAKNSAAVLNQIPDNCFLKNCVCLVSFDEQRSGTYTQLVTSACPGVVLTSFVVRNHASLLDMPRCRLYIMCAEFSERHVIIEEPNLGLGDLKRCTHDVVRKIGGELLILYIRDPGSRRLSDRQIFNENIYCVSTQPELLSLRDKGRFISFYDTLSPCQIKKIQETVKECLL